MFLATTTDDNTDDATESSEQTSPNNTGVIFKPAAMFTPASAIVTPVVQVTPRFSGCSSNCTSTSHLLISSPVVVGKININGAFTLVCVCVCECVTTKSRRAMILMNYLFSLNSENENRKRKTLTPLPSTPRARPYHATENDDCKYAILSFVFVVFDPYSRVSALSSVVLVN